MAPKTFELLAPRSAFHRIFLGPNDSFRGLFHFLNRSARRHDDARGLKTYGVWFLNDRDGALLSAQQYLPTDGVLRRLLVVRRDQNNAVDRLIEAEQAHWDPDPQNPPAGRWRLERGIERKRTPLAPEGLDPGGQIQEKTIKYYQSDLDPKAIEVRQSAAWVSFLGSARLAELEEQLDGQALEQVKQVKYARFVTPLVNLLMLLLGLPFILDRMPGSILADAGRCLLVCGACFLVAFITQSMGMAGHLSALPAWIPVILFTPIAAILLDRIRT